MQPDSDTGSPSIAQTVTTDAAISKDIEDFIYLISHDVRSSVRALIELPQWIAEDLKEAGFEMTGQVESSISLMNRHTCRLDRMLVDLLTFSRIGRMQTVRNVALDEALDEVVDELRITQGFQIVRAIKETHLQIGDRDILTLFNALLSNCIKHHDRQNGRIVVTTALKDGLLRLAVSDDGPGIADEYHDRVFGAMTTLRPRDEIEGSGMGLAHVRKIAMLYGGNATLSQSPYGRGLKVEIALPVDRTL